MANAVQIIGVGARTPLGLGAGPAAAAVWAGTVGLGQHPFMVDTVGDLMPGALDPEIDPRVLGLQRFLLLAESAVREACEPLEGLRRQQLRMPVFLGLPEIRPGFTDQDAAAIRTGVSRFDELPVSLSAVNPFVEGHAAGLSALAAAVEHLTRGAAEVCLVGGVESYFHPDTMEWLDANRQLMGSVSRSGFVPGEGAGFCLLMTDAARQRFGLTPLAGVPAAAGGREAKRIKTTEMCLGEGLATTVRAAVAGLLPPGERITDVYCDINGEGYRSEEWGFACLRLSQFFDDPTAYLSPAECWGDMGAASGPLLVMLASLALARGQSKGPRALIWASSEGGLRGAAVVADTNTGRRGAN